VRAGGGPKKLRLARVGEPRGVIVPTAEIVVEVEARDGSVSRWAPALPVPWPYAWAWRLARLLRVPLVRSFDPGRIAAEVAVPRRG
jgi:hypothetical protein